MLPTFNSIGSRLYYEDFAPYIGEDEAHGYSLAHFCNAIGLLLADVYDVVRDTDDGPGWSPILDPDRAPLLYLPWLGQFVGVQMEPVVPGENMDAYWLRQRQRIKDKTLFERGSAAAMETAAALYLTGSKKVFFRERVSGNAYQLTISTLVDETPDPDKVERILRLLKPAGIVLTYTTITGQDYAELLATSDDYADVEATYPTYGDILE